MEEKGPMEVKDYEGNCLKAVLLFFFVLSTIIATILSIIGFFRFGYNIIDYISGEVVPKEVITPNFLMYVIGRLCGRASLAIAKTIYKNMKK